MSALAAGCRSGGRAGYSNAAVAYFVALAFGWAALEERVSQTITVIAESQSRMVMRFVCVIRVSVCARVSRVCPGSPRCLFTGTYRYRRQRRNDF